MTSDENDFYMKFVALYGVYNFLVLSFVIWDRQDAKKII
jgi:hypothetical protein